MAAGNGEEGRSVRTLCISLYSLVVISAPEIQGAADGGWRFAWSDEFNRDGSPIVPDTWKWDGGASMVREAQLDQANGYCRAGMLVLEAKRVGDQNRYTSAAISSIGLKSWKYGRFEMRGRIDIRQGSWPAWWTTGVSGGWPAGGEIDMMEYYVDQVLFNVMDGAGRWADPRLSAKALGGAYWSSQFHSWVMEWDSTRIDLFLDGKVINHYLVSKADGTGPNGSNPFRQPHYMRLNQAIGATGGDASRTQFPILFEVDYLRHWQWVDSSAFVLTVEQGSGSGRYLPGSQVSITALMPPPGKSFDKWVLTSGSPVLAAGISPATTFSMPSGNVALTATYKDGVSALRGPAFSSGKAFALKVELIPGYDIAGRYMEQIR